MNSLPSFKGFLPIGKEISFGEAVVLTYDEYEAIKLCDYDGLIQLEASEKMEISRPTFTRIYESARQKIAKAIIEVKPIQIKGGQVTLHGIWYKCNSCSAAFNNPTNEEISTCSLCKSEDIALVKNIDKMKADYGLKHQKRNQGQ